MADPGGKTIHSVPALICSLRPDDFLTGRMRTPSTKAATSCDEEDILEALCKQQEIYAIPQRQDERD